MEEILASIRRIIADDEAKAPVAEKPPAPAPTPVPAREACGSRPSARRQAGRHDRHSGVEDSGSGGRGGKGCRAAATSGSCAGTAHT